MKNLILLSFIYLSISLSAQNIGIGTNSPDPSAKLEIDASNAGILIPRINITAVNDATTIPSPATGLMIWNPAVNYGTEGIYYNTGTSTTPNWVKLLNSSSSVNDADSDPTNEHNTNVTLTGNTINIIDGGGTKSQDLSSLKDHDWYESTGTNQADAIGDNIYTQGTVAIGKTNATQKLDVAGNIKLDDNVMIKGSATTRIYRNLVTYNHETPSSSGVFIINTKMP